MIKSMTGYGMARGKVGSRSIVVEAKSVNHKFCEISPHIPSRFSGLETRIIDFTRTFFKRGRVDVYVRDEPSPDAHDSVKIDIPLLKAYYKELKRAAKALKLSSEINLETLLTFPQVVLTDEVEDLEKAWRKIKSLMKAACESLQKMRAREGAAIGRFFDQQLGVLLKESKAIESLVPSNVKNFQKQLEDRIHRLYADTELDSHRLAQEVAYFVDRTDISEELHRLKHHVVHFRKITKGAGPVGRKLDFLLQEMNREVNTLSAKSQSAVISQHVVECKHILEKMREQVQNVE